MPGPGGTGSGGEDDMLAVQSRIAEAERAKGDEPSVIRTSFFETSADNSKKSLCQRFFGCHRPAHDKNHKLEVNLHPDLKRITLA